MEDEKIEYKKSLSELKEGLISIVAILNKHGKGELFFGINSKGEVLSQNINEKTLRDISQTISNHIEPRIYPTIENNNGVIKISFFGKERPYFAYGRAYIRVADEDKKMSAKELENFILKKNKLNWDNEVCEKAILDDIDEKIFLRFKQRYEEINKIKLKGTDKDILKSIGCIKRVKNDFKLTNASILLFSKNPEKLFPMNYITIARYPGKEYGNEYLDMKDFYGNLFDLVDNVDKYVREHIKEKSIVLEDKIPRKIIPQYPYYAIREIITNAVIHRDYSNQNSRIIIRMFKDRIEFNSPGGLPDNVTPENIVYEQSSRNPIIADIFQKIKYIEKMGEGWDKIIDNFKNSEYDVKMPEIIDTKNTVVVKIFSPKEMIEEEVETQKTVGKIFEKIKKNPKITAQNLAQKVGSKLVEKVGEKVGKKVGENQLKILLLMEENPSITIKELSNIIKIAEKNIEININKLKEKNLLKRKGPAKGGYWKINPQYL